MRKYSKNTLFMVFLTLFSTLFIVNADTPPQVINKLCSSNEFFSQIQPGPNKIQCTQPTYAGILNTPGFRDSIQMSSGLVTLVNDLLAPGAFQYYGTNVSGTLGYFSLSGAPVAWGSITGTLSNQTDLQTALNAKQNTLTEGNLSEATSSVLTITGGTSAVIGSGTSIQVKQSSTLQSGYLSSTDWTTFNSKQAAGTYFTGVGTFGSSPNANGLSVASNVLSMQPADDTHPGGLSLSAQTFTGAKTFSTAPIFSSLTASQALVLDASNNVSSLVYTSFPSVSSIVSRDASANTQVNGLLATTAVVAGALVPNASAVPVNGMYLPATNTVGLATNTVSRFTLNTTAAAFSTTLSASNLSGTNTGDLTLGTMNGLSISAQILSLAAATTSTTGALTSTDWNTFNGKQASGNYLTAVTGDVAASGPGSAASTIQSNVVSNAKLAQMSANTIKGNNTAGTANALDLTVSQVQTMLGTSGTNTGDVTLAAIGSTPSANAASLSSQVLTLQPADGTHPGVITSGTQTLGGLKTLSNGVQFATTGGTATTFNYYEEGTFSANFNLGAGASGSGTTFTVKFIRIGNNVTISFPTMTTMTTGTIAQNISTASATIPTRLHPVAGQYGMFLAQNNGLTPNGTWNIESNGAIDLYLSPSLSGTPWTVGSNEGAFGFSATYTLN